MTSTVEKVHFRPLLAKVVAAVALLVAVAIFAGSVLTPMLAGAAQTDQTIANSSTTWQYRDDDAVPAEGWQTSETVTGDEWKTGTGSFGAKNGAIADLGDGHTPATLLTQYRDDGTDIPVYYFRTTFDVEDASAINAIVGSVTYDDAAIVAVNGEVIAEFDNHVQDGTESIYGTQSYGGSNSAAPKTGEVSFSDIDSLDLKATGNVLSVELYQGSSSSDTYLEVPELTLATISDAVQTPETLSTFEAIAPFDANVATVKNVFVNIGSDETQRNFNWLSTSQNDSYVQFAAVPYNFDPTHDSLPTEVQQVSATKSSDYIALSNEFYSFKATFTGFEANTTYAYRVGNDTDGWSSVSTFSTMNEGVDQPFSFIVAGDPQLGAGDAQDAPKWKASINNTFNQLPAASFLLSVGDQINDYSPDALQTEYDEFAAPDSVRKLTLATVVGNHEVGSKGAERTLYSSHYNLPNLSSLGGDGFTGDEGNDYWFTYNGVLFLSLNSNNANLNDHKTFMEQAIAENPDATWTIATFHHAPFSVANHYTDEEIENLRANLTPIISDLGIDVVLTGHDHHYTRSYMLDANGNPTIPEGQDASLGEEAPSEVVNPAEGQVLYITADSASGSKYYTLNSALNGRNPSYSAFSWQENNPSMLSVSVTKDALSIEMYQSLDDNTQDNRWEEKDSFTIKRVSTDDGTGDTDDTDETDDQSDAEEETVQQVSDDTGKGKALPQTGDSFSIAPIVAVAVAAAAALGIGVYAKVRNTH